MSHTQTIVSIQTCLQRANQLQSISDSARLDTELLLCHTINQSRTFLYTWPERELSDIQQEEFNRLFTRRLNGEPIAHILGEKEFWSLSLQVNNSTLIPRPETELLVEIVLELLPQDIPQKILDLGTGTGAIALALAHEHPQWEITAIDQSNAAVKLAQSNQQKLQLNNVAIKQSDWFSNLIDETFDVIVSNPPYIANDDPHLQQGDVRFEPHSALVAENNGLADIEIIAAEAKPYLKPSAWLVVEHGYNQAEQVQAIFRNSGYDAVETRCDLSNQPRATFGKYHPKHS